MKNIVLVGFMGTGKTVIGKMVAEQIDLNYVSTDDLIEKKTGKKITEIFAQEGELFFREMESNVSQDLSLKSDLIVDTGGGIVLNSNNIHLLRKNGYIVCLWASPEVIYERVKSSSHRPLLNVADPLKKITELLNERKPFYEAADYYINTDEMNLEEVASAIQSWYANQQ